MCQFKFLCTLTCSDQLMTLLNSYLLKRKNMLYITSVDISIFNRAAQLLQQHYSPCLYEIIIYLQISCVNHDCSYDNSIKIGSQKL